MSIDSIIYNLLLSHECVIVPGFGGFIVRESPCTLNVAKDRIKPYSKTVFFNQHLVENDGLLVSEVSKLQELTYSEAVLRLENWVISTNQNIKDENKATINELGIFYKGNDNNKWFSPNLNLNLSLKSYGLKSADLEIVSVEKENEVVGIEKTYEPIHTIADRAPIEKLEIAKTNWKAWLAAASIALVSHIGYLGVEKYQASTNQASILPTIVNAIPAKVEIPEVVEKVAEVTNETVVTSEAIIPEMPIVEEKIIEEQPIETVLPTVEPQKELILNDIKTIAAKYKLQQNAINHQLDLSKIGIQAEVNQNAKGLYEVLISK
ncbi:MAG: hypothetical protein HQ463_05235 [Bacteroidetes bacterium]|nr:hypothetical protein [Bacteroidota bacterium]